MTEAELYAQAQQAYLKIKVGARELSDAMKDLMVLNADAGRLPAANAAMLIRGEAMQMEGVAIVSHANAMIALRQHDPAAADGVQTQGGGGR